MAAHNLDKLEGGVTLLRSGQWRWYVIRVSSLPEGRCEVQHLIFVSERPDGGIMRSRVASDVSTIDDTAVQGLAQHPDDRSIRGANGWITVFPPHGSDPLNRWRVRPEGRRPFWSDVQTGTPLGELTGDEMLEIDAQGLVSGMPDLG